MSRTGTGRSPLRFLSASDRPGLYLLGVLSAARGAALVGMAWALAHGISAIFVGTDAWRTAVVIGAVSAVARSILEWAHRVVAARTALGAKERLRAELAARVTEDGGVPEGATTALATDGLDGLDDYYRQFLPALMSSVTIPLVAGAAILFADWVSAIIVVLTVPLVPLFMTLIGLHTRERVAGALDALGRLSDHLVELARGLPVLVGLGRAGEQEAALHDIADRQHRTTLATLRTAFLSALALELVATISVAVVAVFIGVRLVYGDLTLEVGLFALLLAPECFTPLRELGSAFHASEDGVEALGRARGVVDAPRGVRVTTAGEPPLRVRALEVRYPDRSEPAVTGLDFDLGAGEILVLDGPSGAGKSTVFAALTGRLSDLDGGARVSGTVTGVPAGAVAWLPQRPRTVADTALGELELYGAADDRADALEVLAQLGLATAAAVHPSLLSPGELRRLAFGRVLMRVRAGARLALLDEPTAHLDERSARAIVRIVQQLARDGVAVVVASHDPRVRALASRSILLAGGSHAVNQDAPDTVAATATAERKSTITVDNGPDHSAWRELVSVLRPVAPRFALAAVLGTLAAAFAVALTGVSAWLIVRAAEQPPIMYLMVAIVGVRFFGLGRAVLRYVERLVTHDAVFGAVTTLRMRLWRGLAARGVTDRDALESGRTLDRLVRDADLVRDLSVRVVQPIAVALLVSAGVLVTAWLIHPPAVVPFAVALLVCLVVAPAIAVVADRSASRGEQVLRSTVLRRFASLVAASDDLAANGVDARVRDDLARADQRASGEARRSAGALGSGGAVVVLATSLLAVLLLPLTAPVVAAGALDAALVAVLCLVPLGVADVLLDHVEAIQQAPALRDALHRVARTTSGVREHGGATIDAPISALELEDVAAAWPGSSAPLFESFAARLVPGDWLTVSGPSGAGKTTLLMILLGELQPIRGSYTINGVNAADIAPASLRSHIAWCPQEGHLFNSTLRGNLIIARDRADRPDDDELESTLRRVGLGTLLARLPLGLDTPIGSAGSFLSGGERQRVAVARTLLARADVVLVDEPTAHLDEEAASSLMHDLREALADRIAVLVTHHAADVRPGDQRIELGGNGEAAGTALGRSAVGAPA